MSISSFLLLAILNITRKNASTQKEIVQEITTNLSMPLVVSDKLSKNFLPLGKTQSRVAVSKAAKKKKKSRARLAVKNKIM